MSFRASPPVLAEYAFRSAPDGSPVFEGYAAVFNRPSRPITDQFGVGYVETIRPGAFDRTLAMPSRKTFVVDHDEKLLLSTTNGGLRLAQDSQGLHVESTWPNTDYAHNVRALHDSGEKLAMSFTSRWTADGHRWSADRLQHEVSQAILRHVAVLAWQEPAFPDTLASFRSLAERTNAAAEDIEDLVEGLRAGVDLNDAQKHLLTRLAAAVAPEAGETAPIPEPPAETPPEQTVAYWREKFDAILQP
jgi:HK97 family phage prohead protease